jgi:hypothetical protein
MTASSIPEDTGVGSPGAARGAKRGMQTKDTVASLGRSTFAAHGHRTRAQQRPIDAGAARQ